MYLDYSKGKWSLILLQKEEDNDFYSKVAHSNATQNMLTQFSVWVLLSFQVPRGEQPDYNKSYSKASLGSSLSPIGPSAILTPSGSSIPEVRPPSELNTFQYQLQGSKDSSASQALPFASFAIYSKLFY